MSAKMPISDAVALVESWGFKPHDLRREWSAMIDGLDVVVECVPCAGARRFEVRMGGMLAGVGVNPDDAMLDAVRAIEHTRRKFGRLAKAFGRFAGVDG